MEMIFSDDPYKMNWIREDYEYAKVICPNTLNTSVKHEKSGDQLKTTVSFSNNTEWSIFTSETSIGIMIPLQDRYESSEICMKKRCHAHVFCGQDISYICASRMGGDPPHLGILFTEGTMDSYSIVRKEENSSNDRGCFLLHPKPMEVLPHQTVNISWIIFSHSGKEDFMNKVSQYQKFVHVNVSDFVLFRGKSVQIRITPSFKAKNVYVDGKAAQFIDSKLNEWGYEVFFHDDAYYNGIKKFDIEVDGIKTYCSILLQESVWDLAEKRCRFIVENQQYEGENDRLKGAYLVYDNEENHLVYDHMNDCNYNAGRERVGMGLLVAKYLQKFPNEKMECSLKKYETFVKRELVAINTGEVFNECGKDNSYTRLYNMPWYATFFVELYHLYGRKEYLEYAAGIVNRFYEKGGYSHYPIEMPVLELCKLLSKTKMYDLEYKLKNCFTKHAEHIIKNGCYFPAHEVNYEQSIVAPAADILLQMYFLTNDEKYLENGKKQLDFLELFNGFQPDVCLYETAIRHWDGYWCGKRKLYGDTFPHYWSALTGNCYLLYGKATGNQKYIKKGWDSLHAVLPLFFPDGRASCAHVFPKTVNDVTAGYFDPYANDQDWGLYFNLRADRIDSLTDERK